MYVLSTCDAYIPGQHCTVGGSTRLAQLARNYVELAASAINAGSANMYEDGCRPYGRYMTEVVGLRYEAVIPLSRTQASTNLFVCYPLCSLG